MNTEILELQKSMWKYLSLIGIIVLLAIYLVRSINRTYIRPINEVTYATSLISMDTIMLEYLKAMLRRQKRYLSRLTILQDGYKSLIINKNAIKSIKNNIRKYTKFSIND